ncbi:hypothetical protein THIX_60973 [Thiomonas sp. X19]|uniref:hypothetical protein n=1 Tax=Thiomonas sp. X19 TaxID=1050370 RepID=UPI000B6EBB15|nr:hypothetical protein [Thiomonas sp. X19]SCC94915.1 hypothetical protein THIX_60973 [Thiomonas sp. X19]
MNSQFKQTPFAAAISGGLNLPADFMSRKFKIIGAELFKLKVQFETDEIQNEFWIYCSFKSRVISRARRMGQSDLHIFNAWGRYFVTTQTKRRADWFADSLDTPISKEDKEGGECLVDNLSGDLNGDLNQEGDDDGDGEESSEELNDGDLNSNCVGEIAAWRAAEFSDYEEDWARRHTPEAIQARLGCCMKTAQNHFKRALETAEWLRKNPELFNLDDYPEIDDETLRKVMWRGKRKYQKRGPDSAVQGSLI